MKYRVKYFILALVVVLVSCSTDPPAPVLSDFDYFPLQKGSYQIYAVEETEYTVVNGMVKRTYELMTEVVDSFPGSEGFTYVMYRSKRDNNTNPWKYVETWSARADGSGIIVDEGNISYAKLAFPLREGKKWNGNEYNINEEDEYVLENVGKPLTVGTLEFSDGAVVNENSFEDPIVMVDKRKAAYARGVGLVLREVTLLNYCTDANCLGQKKIETGIISTQRIIEYGVK